MEDRSTIIFGLDGACFDLLDPWLDKEAFPTLQRLIEAGGKSGLESCVPATTPPAWTTLTTGVNPGKHGIFGFYGRRRNRYGVDPVSGRDVHARRLWDYTTEAGMTALVVNVPVTHPAGELDGALVPGYLAPENPSTYPDEILSDLCPHYQIYAESEAADVPERQLCAEWLDLTESRCELALALMEAYDWDLLFLEFQKTDGAVHKFDDEENIRAIYARVDECMGEIIRATDDEPNVFVVSDHGIGQPKEWSVALNTWLAAEGYVETTVRERRQRDWMEQATGAGQAEAAARSGSSTSFRGQIFSGLVTRLSRFGITKQELERLLSTLGVYELAARLAPEGAGNALGTEVVDRAASTAFYEGMGFSGVDTGIVLNDERFYGEGEGTLDPAAYEAVREELFDALESLTGPDGETAFDSVRRREDVYHGPRTEYAPDLVLEQAPDYVIGSSDPRGQTFIPAEPGRIDHTRTGLLVAAGPDIRPDWSLSTTPSILDVTPTLLAGLGIALNTRFDGEPLTGLFTTEPTVEHREYEPLEKTSSYELSESDEEALEERLRGMGYLE